MENQLCPPANPSDLGRDAQSASQTDPMSFVDLFIGLFLEPSKIFRQLRHNPTWVVPIVTLVAAGLVVSAVWLFKMDPLARAQHSLDALSAMIGNSVPESAVQEALDNAKRPILKTLAWGFIDPWLRMTLLGLVIWAFARMGSVMEKEPVPFSHAFSLAAVHNLVMLPTSLIMVVTMLFKPVGGLSEMAMNPLSLGYVVHPENIWLKGLFTGVLDPFYLFSFFLLALGMHHTLRAKPWATAVAVGLVFITSVPLRLIAGAI